MEMRILALINRPLDFPWGIFILRNDPRKVSDPDVMLFLILEKVLQTRFTEYLDNV